MKPIEYVLSIDFGIANTKILCWDISKDEILPVKLGDGYRDGIMPTVVQDSDSHGFCFSINFFDTPNSMKTLGDTGVFESFVKKMFQRVLDHNASMLVYDIENQEWNFLVILSYPEMWKEEDGNSFLRMIQKIIPPTRYAIKAQYTAFKEYYLRNRKNKEEQWLMGEISSGCCSFLTTRPFDKVCSYYGACWQLVEAYMLEKAVSAVESGSDNISDGKLVQLLEENCIPEAEYYLRRHKEFVLTNYKEKQRVESTSKLVNSWLDEALTCFGDNLENIFREYKKQDFVPSNICLIGSVNDFFINSVVKKVFPNANIMNVDLFGICRGVLQYFQEVYRGFLNIYSIFEKVLLDTSDNSIFQSKTSDEVSTLISNICEDNCNQFLDNYTKRDSDTSYKDFIKDIENYYTNELQHHMTGPIQEEMGKKVLNIINETTQGVIKEQEEYVKNNVGNYFNLVISPLKYNNDILYYELVNEVFEKLHTFVGANMNAVRDVKDRVKAYNKVKDYLRKAHHVKIIPKISWVILEKCELCKLYLLDTCCMNLYIQTSVLNLNPQYVDLSGIKNAIYYAINKIVDEYFRELYKLDGDNWVFNSKSIVRKWEKFDYNTYLQIKKEIGDKTIELNVSKIEGAVKINHEYPAIYKKVKDFFGITPSYTFEFGTPEDFPFKIDDLCNIIINEYLVFRKH